MTASDAIDARNPDGAGDGMGRNVSGDPADNFHDTQKTPEWLTDLIAHTEAYAADIAHGNPAADYLTDGHREWTRAQDQAHPGRPCAWCYHPRNSPECNFAEGHTPYMETFGGWDALKAENLPPCRLCGHPIKPGQWVTPDGSHHDCAEAFG